jgi:hypothetical protein
MIRRRRPLLRAAVIGGGAYAVGHHAAARSASQAQQEDNQDARIGDLEQQQAPSQEAAAPAAGPSLLEQLNQLDVLHTQGALSDGEFTAAKGKLLGS